MKIKLLVIISVLLVQKDGSAWFGDVLIVIGTMQAAQPTTIALFLMVLLCQYNIPVFIDIIMHSLN
jgi:hypothetical protein